MISTLYEISLANHHTSEKCLPTVGIVNQEYEGFLLLFLY